MDVLVDVGLFWAVVRFARACGPPTVWRPAWRTSACPSCEWLHCYGNTSLGHRCQKHRYCLLATCLMSAAHTFILLLFCVFLFRHKPDKVKPLSDKGYYLKGDPSHRSC